MAQLHEDQEPDRGQEGGVTVSKDLVKIDDSDLAKLRRELDAVKAGMDVGLRPLYSDLAQSVVEGARSKIPSKTGRARNSLRATEGVITYGQGVPYVPWLDFGGAVGINKSVQRPVLQSGRYLFPALSANKGKGMEAAEKALTSVVEKNGLEVDG